MSEQNMGNFSTEEVLNLFFWIVVAFIGGAVFGREAMAIIALIGVVAMIKTILKAGAWLVAMMAFGAIVALIAAPLSWVFGEGLGTGIGFILAIAVLLKLGPAAARAMVALIEEIEQKRVEKFFRQLFRSLFHHGRGR